jgi:hypothetical protein
VVGSNPPPADRSADTASQLAKETRKQKASKDIYVGSLICIEQSRTSIP